MVEYLAGGKVPGKAQSCPLRSRVTGGRMCGLMGRAGERRWAPASTHPTGPAQGGVSSRLIPGLAVSWRHQGTWPALQVLSAMASVARGSDRLTLLRLRHWFLMAALLGTLAPQVRSRQTRSLQGEVRGRRGLWRSGAAGMSGSPLS